MDDITAGGPIPRTRIPAPPRFDLWPETMLHALRLRGALVPCGPGFRGVGWPDDPAVRLAALGAFLGGEAFASHLTAAWVWGAARRVGDPLEIAVPRGRRAGAQSSTAVRCAELRLERGDLVRLGQFAVTDPARTATDLLRSRREFGRTEKVACRLLLQRVPGGAAALRSRMRAQRRPHTRIALERLRLLGE